MRAMSVPPCLRVPPCLPRHAKAPGHGPRASVPRSTRGVWGDFAPRHTTLNSTPPRPTLSRVMSRNARAQSGGEVAPVMRPWAMHDAVVIMASQTATLPPRSWTPNPVCARRFGSRSPRRGSIAAANQQLRTWRFGFRRVRGRRSWVWPGVGATLPPRRLRTPRGSSAAAPASPRSRRPRPQHVDHPTPPTPNERA